MAEDASSLMNLPGQEAPGPSGDAAVEEPSTQTPEPPDYPFPDEEPTQTPEPASDGEQPALPEEYFLKGVVKALLIIALFSMTLLVLPLVGLVTAFLVGPYLAGYIGGKHTCHGTLLGFVVGMIWSSALVILIIYMAGRFSISGNVKIGSFELALIAIIYFLNILFCSIGGWISSSKVPACRPAS